MKNVAELFHGNYGSRYLGPATILDATREGVKVRLKGEDGAPPTHAAAMVSVGMMPNIGDTVLVVSDDSHQMYVIGILRRNSVHETQTPRIDAADGACAVIDDSGDAQKIQVFSNDQKLLFEYNTQTRRASVMLEAGDLTIQAKRGDIALDTPRNIRLKGNRIEMQSRWGAQISAGDPSQKLHSRVSLDPGHVRLSGYQMGISANAGDLRFGTMDCKAGKVTGELSHVRLAMKRLETIVDTVIGKAKSVYQQVATLTELKTGRLRTLIRGSWHTTSSETILKADKAFKVKGDKIHLG